MTRTILLLLALSAAPVWAENDHNAHAWFMYFGDHPIRQSRWGVHLEGQWRRADVGLKWQQLLLRPGVNYQVNPKLMLTAGYGFIDTFRYGDFPARERFQEHRIFEQAAVTTPFRGLDFQHRLRLEQRSIRGFAQRYENRFRYMLRTSVPIPGSERFYIGLYNEIFVNFGKNVAANRFDQNRAYVALGRKMGKDSRIEFGFLEQTVQQRSGRVFEHNHTLQLAIFSKLPFGR